MLGNKWVEIAKSLPGRNDNAVKNFFYSAVRKYIRKIAKGRISVEQKTNEMSKNISLYFCEYIKRMYADYLAKLARNSVQGDRAAVIDANFESDLQPERREQILKEYEMDETKEEKARSMKSGEKYIIRKLISFKINIPKIDEYIQKVSAIEIKQNKMMNFPGNTSNPVSEGYYEPYRQPASAPCNQGFMPQQYLGQAGHTGNTGHNNASMNNFKTLSGYNDDSQIAYYNQNFLFQAQGNNYDQFAGFNNNLIASMQNLNLDGSN